MSVINHGDPQLIVDDQRQYPQTYILHDHHEHGVSCFVLNKYLLFQEQLVGLLIFLNKELTIESLGNINYII